MRTVMVFAALLLLVSGVAMADNWTFTYTSGTCGTGTFLCASGVLQAPANGGVATAAESVTLMFELPNTNVIYDYADLSLAPPPRCG
jgi:hypothetical protein